MLNFLFNISSSTAKHIFDGGSLLIVAGTIANALPNISAALAATWFAIQIGNWIYTHIKKKNNDRK